MDLLWISVLIVGCAVLFLSIFLLFQAAKVQTEAKRRELLVTEPYDGVWLALLASLLFFVVYVWAWSIQIGLAATWSAQVIVQGAHDLAALPFILALLQKV